MSETKSNAPQIVARETNQARREELAKKAGRFRILIVGRANAGKTTILKKICNTVDEPEIYDKYGKKVLCYCSTTMNLVNLDIQIDTSKIEPSASRGIHDIENEMIFRSNPGFIFHDSCGFESGATDELQKVKDFVAKRSREKKLENQIHVIWYCIPMSESRPITYAEEIFFSEVGTGKVPVVAVFTKSEALIIEAIRILQEEENLSYADAIIKAPKYAKEHLQITHLNLEKCKYPPSGHVYIQEMEKASTDCAALVECTASVLTSDTLEAVFVSTQQVSIEVCIEYAIRFILEQRRKNNDAESLEKLKMVMKYFPFWILDYRLEQREYDRRDRDLYEVFNNYHSDDISSIVSALNQLAQAVFTQPETQVVQLGTALVIVVEHLFFVWKYQEKTLAADILSTILAYQQSPICVVVKDKVNEALGYGGPGGSVWRNMTHTLSHKIIKRKKHTIQRLQTLSAEIYNIVLENRMDKTGLKYAAK